MKIEVAKPDLEAALQVVSIGTSSTGNDLTTHYVFKQQSDDMVEVFSNNNRLGVSMPLAGCQLTDGKPGDAFTVEAKRLNEWLAAQADVVLGIAPDKGRVKCTTPQGSVHFASMDPALFPYWDEALKSVPEGIKIPARRLRGAFAHVKLYISDKDTTTPKISVTEIRKESLQATDGGALTVITIPDLAKSSLRIHGRDLGQVLSFLAACGDENVECREHDRCLFLVREDGGVLSVGRPHHAFPEIGLDKKPLDPHWWVVRTEELLRAAKTLKVAASDEDTRMHFDLKDGMVTLTMASAAGGERDTLRVEAQEHGSLPDAAVAMPQGGFDIAYPYLLKLLMATKSETIKFGLNPNLDKKTGKPNGGWVRFREERNGDDYLTLLVWLV
jgi:hypothetical protein